MARLADRDVRQLVDAEFKAAGWRRCGDVLLPPAAVTKESIRAANYVHRISRASRERDLVAAQGLQLLEHFASGHDVVPAEFDPDLIPVRNRTLEADLFRFATLFWSVPVSRGYGRRMRYLVVDRSNMKVVGILALGDPVFNLRARDSDISWGVAERKSRLYNVMDAYVLGAVPPYNKLLGGKFIALSAVSDNIRADFRAKYRNNSTVIAETTKVASLALVTTTSALGRSSIYNRLTLPGEDGPTFRSVGFSSGYGHFHISDTTFEILRRWLRQKADPYADGHEYGDGPNWRLRTIRRALDRLGFHGDLLKHGIQREVFVAPLARNYAQFLRGDHAAPRYYKRPLAAIAEHFRTRWMIPRSIRNDEWRAWRVEDSWQLISSLYR